MAVHRDSAMWSALGLRFYYDEFGDILPRGNSFLTDVMAEMQRLSPLRPMPLDEVRAVIEQAIDQGDGTEAGRVRIFLAPSNPGRGPAGRRFRCRQHPRGGADHYAGNSETKCGYLQPRAKDWRFSP